MRFLLKPVPYVGLFFGVCWLMISASLMTKEQPDGPAEISLADLERKSCDDLPEWLSVDDGIPYWPEAATVYTERDGRKENKKLLVPLLTGSTVNSWPNISSDRNTGFLLEFSWAELRDLYPQAARAFSITAPEQQTAEFLLNMELEPFPVSFRPVESDVAYLILSGAEKMAVEDMKDAGFREVAVVRPGTKPILPDEAPGLAGMGLVFTTVSGFWIYRRRKRRKQAATLAVAIENGFRNGMEGAFRSQVTAGVENAIEKHRQRQQPT